MTSSTAGWPGRHFSLANGTDRPSDLPRLLRRVAEEIERYGIGPMELMDLTVSQEITAEGPVWSVTVYWSPDAPD